MSNSNDTKPGNTEEDLNIGLLQINNNLKNHMNYSNPIYKKLQ